MASPVRFPQREAEEARRRLFNPDGTPIENSRDKFWRKMKEQPIVPLGSLATCGALIMASHYLRVGNRDQFQRALRWRVGLQGVTVLGAVVGTLYLGSGAPAAAPAPPIGDGASGSGSGSRAGSGPGPSSAVAGIATVPGRPATVHQATRAEERREAERQLLRERLQEAEMRQEAEQKRRAEEALLGRSAAAAPGAPGDAGRARPVIGQDRRDRSQ